MILNTIIIEDEPLSREFLKNLLAQFCPEINIIGTAATEDDAIALITKLKPDLVFLDIELQKGTGFGVLKDLNSTDFQVVFTTALDDEAIKTIRISGVDYLQKPIDIDSLKSIIKSVIEKRNNDTYRTALQHLLTTLQNDNVPVELMISSEQGSEYVTIKDIIHINATNTGSNFTLRSGEQKKATKQLKELEQLLSSYEFFRPHSDHIVNTKEIIKMIDEGEGSLIMKNNSILPVSRKKREEVQAILNDMP